MTILLAALIVAAAIVWGAQLVASALAAPRDDERRRQALAILDLFAPAIAAVQADPRALLVWHPLASSARALFADAFADLDRVSGNTFPFTEASVQAAHARWTTDWLAWERSHDATYKRKAIETQHELADAAPAVLRGRLEAVEQEKLELYQRRYEEYVRVAKALQSLATAGAAAHR